MSRPALEVQSKPRLAWGCTLLGPSQTKIVLTHHFPIWVLASNKMVFKRAHESSSSHLCANPIGYQVLEAYVLDLGLRGLRLLVCWYDLTYHAQVWSIMIRSRSDYTKIKYTWSYHPGLPNSSCVETLLFAISRYYGS